MHDAVSAPHRDIRYMGMFGYNNMPPPMGPPGDWYHPSMSNMYEGREGSFPRDYPSFRDMPDHLMAMMRDAPYDSRGYSMGPPLPPPEMLDQLSYRIGRPNPSYSGGSMNLPRSSHPSGRVNMDSHSFYGPGSLGDGISPRSSGMVNPSQSPWNGNQSGSFWAGRSFPPHFGSFPGYPMEGSGAKDDDNDDEEEEDGNDDHGEESPQGKSMQL